MGDTAEEIASDVALVGRLESVPTMLRVLCEITGMGFAAVARVTDGSWTACAVRDEIAFGLKPGGQLDVNTTLCKEVRFARAPVVIEQASIDPVYCDHHTPRIYSIESYVSVPIVLPGGAYFGNLCAIDRRPAKVAEPRIVAMFNHFAALIATQFENERRRDLVQTALLDERAAGELREQLIAILGHDLRMPIGSIALSSQLLKAKANDPAAVASIASQINDAAKRATSLIDNVLDFARGRLGGSIAVRPALVERVEEALFSVVSEMQSAHPAREIEWQFDIGGQVRLDRGRIQQVATHLLANALAHNPPKGKVRISARASAGDFVLEVWNDGKPMPAESLIKVFAPFWRRESSTQREGLGLGLHICSQIVRAHGGDLRVASTAEDGTTFTATLPQASR